MPIQKKPVVEISFINGLSFGYSVGEIFGALTDEFALVESTTPQICISGPYGAQKPPKGAFRVSYLCENVWPNPDDFDWCFGTWREDVVRHPRYTCITWHGFDPATLIKTPDQVARWLEQPRRFCNFFYSNQVSHRESFCRELAQYRAIDCPGKSLRNMPPIDNSRSKDKWAAKRDFLGGYKFTVAFENSSAPGYHTEKILDPMLVGSVPIYWGDPTIARDFNPRSFISVSDFVKPPGRSLDALLRRWGRRTLVDYRPAAFNRVPDRGRRFLHHLSTRTADWLVRRRGWTPVVTAIRQLDQDSERFAAMLAEPWLPQNRPAETDAMREQWRRLFASCATAGKQSKRD